MLQKEAGPETILSLREVVFVGPNGQLANRLLGVVSPDCLLNLLSAGVWRDDQEFSIAVLPPFPKKHLDFSNLLPNSD